MAPSILNLLYNDYVKPYKRYVLILTMIIIFGVAGMYAFKWSATPLFNEGMGSGSGSGSGSGGGDIANYNDRRSVELYFFYADWCPHCTTAKPQWSAFKSSYEGNEVNGYKIKCNEVDCSDGTSPLIQTHNVNGYPTLIMVKDGDKINFDSKISTDNLTQFVNSVLQ